MKHHRHLKHHHQLALLSVGALAFVHCGLSQTEADDQSVGDEAVAAEVSDALHATCTPDAGQLADALKACLSVKTDAGHHANPLPCFQAACGLTSDGGAQHGELFGCLAKACGNGPGFGAHDGGHHWRHHHPGLPHHHDGGAFGSHDGGMHPGHH